MNHHLKKITKIIFGERIYFILWKIFVKNPENKKKEQEIQRKNEESIFEYKNKFNPRVFIETGTYRGDMVETMKTHFNKIYSIELGDMLCKKAQKRFAHDKHVEIIHGDSGKELPKLLERINEPALFWLDAHFSTGVTVRADIDTPIAAELRTILNHRIKNHVILIDDARHFVGVNGYPQAEVIEKMAIEHGYLFEMKRDNFRIYPKK